MPRHSEKKIKLKSVNPCITCTLCKGYLIEAHTITECLHTFCKSCIVKYLKKHNTCPKCCIIIHQSHPLNYISHDRTMQDIVYKLVPRLQEHEERREEKFYRRRGLPNPKAESSEDNNESREPHQETNEDRDYHKKDEQLKICLEKTPTTHIKTLKRKYLMCSSHATVTVMKKFLAMKLYNSPGRYKEVDIMCNEEILGKDHTLKFVYKTRWRQKDIPLLLRYRPRLDV